MTRTSVTITSSAVVARLKPLLSRDPRELFLNQQYWSPSFHFYFLSTVSSNTFHGELLFICIAHLIPGLHHNIVLWGTVDQRSGQVDGRVVLQMCPISNCAREYFRLVRGMFLISTSASWESSPDAAVLQNIVWIMHSVILFDWGYPGLTWVDFIPQDLAKYDFFFWQMGYDLSPFPRGCHAWQIQLLFWQ